jgi:hypothetical protein
MIRLVSAMHLFGVVLSLLIVLCTPIYGCISKANPTLNVRKTPSATGAIVSSLYQGSTVKCLEKQNGFCRIGTT